MYVYILAHTHLYYKDSIIQTLYFLNENIPPYSELKNCTIYGISIASQIKLGLIRLAKMYL